MTKQEKIKEAYGDCFENMKPWINASGWFDKNAFYNQDFIFKYQDLNIFFCHIGDFMIPKSLQGIENNNGWTKIESESDVPKTGYYELIERESGKQTRGIISNDLAAKESLEYYSHYQAIEKILKPIY